MERDLEKAATCGEPSYVWRAGQDRRLEMILAAAGERIKGRVLDNGCGVGMYVERMAGFGGQVFGIEYEIERAVAARTISENISGAAGENLPFPTEVFDLVLSHEVLEHVRNDRQAAQEIARVLRPGGRAVIFVPNRGYPFETHGIFWRGKYRFGNIPLVNYLPRKWRNRLAPHVRVYSKKDLLALFEDLPVRILEHRIIFGAYDNIITRLPRLGRGLRMILQNFERTPLQALGLSHLLVIEKDARA
jgi:SAM-dependent methyltransferase